ncbi:MAG: PAS domain-containing protein [Anaerolineales bacterium]|nr:PAS domain-containing protein [Anaerolineales bacterium]
MFQLTPIALVVFITTAINLVVTYISWQRRKARSGIYFTLGMACVTFWTLAVAFDYAAIPLSLKVFFAKAEAWGYCSALALFAMFAISFAGNEAWLSRKWVRTFFFLIPASNIFLITTNELHGWIWTSFKEIGGNIVIFEHGPGFLWVTATSYLMTLIIIANLWLASRRGSAISRRQGRLLLYAILVPVSANFVYLFEIDGMEGVDWTSITFSITGVLFLRALYGQRLLDLIPIARDKLINSLADGMIVLDAQNRIIDINQTAANMITIPAEELLGKDLTDISPPTRTFLELPVEHEINDELKVEGAQKRYFDFLISPLRDGPRGIIGRLIIFREITDRKENEIRLLQLAQELQETQAQVVEQQRTLAKLEERKRLGRDMHDSVNQSLHSLMLFSETLNSLLDKNQIEKAKEVAERIQESGRQALKEIRLLVFDTQSLLADDSKDLIHALEERLNMVERRVGIKAEVVYMGDAIVDSAPEWKENLYWITIEALNNALKHSQARKIQINIRYTNRQLNLEINDDGIGFNLNRMQNGGLGMRTMRERAELLGGQISIKSSPGEGTLVSFKAETEAWYG